MENQDVNCLTYSTSKQTLSFSTNENIPYNSQNVQKPGKATSISKSKFASKSKILAHKADEDSFTKPSTRALQIEDNNDNFTDADCGEVMIPQCVLIDFTPDEDDKEMEQKCIDFWEFVNNNPHLEEYLQKPQDIGEMFKAGNWDEATEKDNIVLDTSLLYRKN